MMIDEHRRQYHWPTSMLCEIRCTMNVPWCSKICQLQNSFALLLVTVLQLAGVKTPSISEANTNATTVQHRGAGCHGPVLDGSNI